MNGPTHEDELYEQARDAFLAYLTDLGAEGYPRGLSILNAAEEYGITLYGRVVEDAEHAWKKGAAMA